MTAQLQTPDAAEATEVAEAKRGHIGRIVIGSLGTGLVAALILVLLVLPGATEPVVLGTAMLAFALGWAMLAVLSTRRTSQPQTWARVPAAAMAIAGTALLLSQPGDQVMSALGWIWPPAVLVLAIWMIRSVRRALRSRTRNWLVQPVCAVLAIAAVAGGAETVLESMDHNLQAPAGQTYEVAGHKMFLRCTGTGSPPFCCPAASASAARAGPGSSTQSPPPPGSASTTGPARDGANLLPVRRTALSWPPTYTPSSPPPTSPAPTCWPVTRSAAPTT